MKMALCHNQLEYKPMPWTDRVKRRLKLRDLDFLAALIETGTMGKAAGRLHVSQPAVSKAIADLERTLGVRLVDRSRRGIVPTPYGVAMGKRIVAIFNDLRQGVQEIDFLSDPTKGEIRIGTTEPIAAAIVTPAIDRLSREYPQMIFCRRRYLVALQRSGRTKRRARHLSHDWPVARGAYRRDSLLRCLRRGDSGHESPHAPAEAHP
jgi:DNA-binding transcriptional LysR family regulator